MSSPEVNQYFVAVLREYEMLGLMGLGKIADPTSNEAKVDLMRTQFAIGVLEMLEQKTGGHLADLERQELQRVLTTLRLNYVEEMKRSQEPAGTTETDAADTGTAKTESTDAPGAGATAEQSRAKKPASEQAAAQGESTDEAASEQEGRMGEATNEPTMNEPTTKESTTE